MQLARLRQFDHNELYREYYNKARNEKLKKSQELLAQKKQRHKTKRRTEFLTSAFVLCFIVFGLLYAVVYRYAEIFERNYNIESLEREIVALEREIENINGQTDSTIVLQNVEYVAINDLGMQYPKPEQIIYLNQKWDYKIEDEQEFKIANKEYRSSSILNHNYTALVNVWLSDE